MGRGANLVGGRSEASDGLALLSSCPSVAKRSGYLIVGAHRVSFPARKPDKPRPTDSLGELISHRLSWDQINHLHQSYSAPVLTQELDHF